MDEHEDEIKLMDYLNVLWKRKWLIIIPTFFLVFAVGAISFFLPQKWEIDAIIQPSKYIIQTEGGTYISGTYKEILIVDPKQIASQINQESYNHLIATELNLDIKKFPKFRAENLQDTNLVRVSTKVEDVETAKLVLNSLFNHLKRKLDKKIDIERNGIDSEINSNEIEKSRIEKEINTSKNKLKIVKQRKKEIENEMSDIRRWIATLKEEHRLSLKKENRNESESIAMLLYSNEIQQSLRYHNTLNELLSDKKIEEEDINLEIENKEKIIKQVENKIDNLNEKKGRLDYAQLIKEPTSSLSPVSPKKKLNVMIAGILGLIIFTMLAFFLDYLEREKAQRKV